jgi:hypothetical protein
METWDTLYKRKRQEQREGRGAQVRYQQLRQEIADLAIHYVELDYEGAQNMLFKLEAKVRELRALVKQYPNVKEGM